MTAVRTVGPSLDEMQARLADELRRHPLLARGAVVMRSDLASALDTDADTVEVLTAYAVSAGHIEHAAWLQSRDGDDAALVAVLPVSGTERNSGLRDPEQVAPGMETPA